MTTKPAKALIADSVSICLGDKTIIQNCSFQVTPGEFIGIIGPNGAGKSTLLKGLRGMIKVSEGKVSVFNHPIPSLTDKEAARLIAYMQQEVNARFGFTGLQIVLAGRYPHLKWWQNETENDRRVAKKYMEFTGTEGFADTPITEVSGGERQRILLAKVLAQETPLIFLDEPTASLDLLYQEEIFRYCQAFSQEGKSILLIAHDIKLAAKFCSRLILLADGKIVADGKPSEVLTEENLEKAYGLHATVYINKVTGNLDIHTYAAAEGAKKCPSVHVIGGGGAAGEVMRSLYERGYPLTAGILQDGDTDAEVAEAFGIEFVRGAAFREITPRQAQSHFAQIVRADIVILGSLCYGKQNLANLQVALGAKKLLIIEDTPISERDFTGGAAQEIYQKLLQQKNVTVMTSVELMKKIEENRIC